MKSWSFSAMNSHQVTSLVLRHKLISPKFNSTSTITRLIFSHTPRTVEANMMCMCLCAIHHQLSISEPSIFKRLEHKMNRQASEQNCYFFDTFPTTPNSKVCKSVTTYEK
uniref:Uncharacterized protein n=1 Tax=Setaria italica TaxID=4555 RepID=K3ZY99_SETIT